MRKIIVILAIAFATTTTAQIPVFFTADWCGRCADSLKKVQNEGVVLVIDVDKKPELAKRYGVRTVPTLLIMQSDDRPQQPRYQRKSTATATQEKKLCGAKTTKGTPCKINVTNNPCRYHGK